VAGPARKILNQGRRNLDDTERIQPRRSQSGKILAEFRVGITTREQVIERSLEGHSFQLWRHRCKGLTDK
jgi:hypothetical protein